MATLSTYVTFLAVILATGVAIKPPMHTPSITKEAINRRVNTIVETQGNLKNKVTRMSAQRDSIIERLTAIEYQLSSHQELLTVEELLRQSEARNQEMTKMLSKFERFFGSLYADTPQAFDPTVAVDVRMSKLNSYLGNREAELLALRPAPPTVVEEETVNQELLGDVLYDIENQRNNMDKKLRKLEERLARMASRSANSPCAEDTQDTLSGPAGNNRRNKRSIENPPSTSMDNDEILGRLERLENLMVLQLLPLLNKTLGESSFRGLGSPSDALYNLTQLEKIEEEISALRANRPDSKKIAFSVARTTHLLGESTAQIVEFDHIFLNKGGHFNEANSTFICAVAGYYFVTYTVRSFDGYVLGVFLMKNTDYVSSVFTDAHDRNVMETQSVITQLEKGDILWLRHPPSDRFAIHSDRFRYTTFSAFLIFKGN